MLQVSALRWQWVLKKGPECPAALATESSRNSGIFKSLLHPAFLSSQPEMIALLMHHMSIRKYPKNTEENDQKLGKRKKHICITLSIFLKKNVCRKASACDVGCISSIKMSCIGPFWFGFSPTMHYFSLKQKKKVISLE